MSKPINLLDMTSKEFEKFLDSFDHVFSDCDGVIWDVYSKKIEGSDEFFKLIKKHGKTVHYLSNNSMRSKEDYEIKFKACGIENGYDNLITPVIATAEYLKSVNFNKKIYCVTCSETRNVLESYGFICKYGPDKGAKDFIGCLPYLNDDKEIGAVVFELDFAINIPKLYQAITYLERPEVLFIKGNVEKYTFLIKDRMLVVPDAFAEYVVDIVKREPLILGKPGRIYGESAMRRAGVKDPSRVLMIGDLIESDIALGKNLGFKTLLVLTGEGKEGMKNLDHFIPDYYAPSIGSIVPQLLKK